MATNSSTIVLNYVLEAIKIIVPFLLGLTSAIWLSKRDKYLQRKNLQKIFLHEISYNLDSFVFFETAYSEPDEQSLSQLQDGLITEVFDQYLDRLCDLPDYQIEAIYKAYTGIKRWKSDGIRIHEENEPEHANESLITQALKVTCDMHKLSLERAAESLIKRK